MIGHTYLPPPPPPPPQSQQSYPSQSQCTLQQALSDSGIHQPTCQSIVVDSKSSQNSEGNDWEANFQANCEQSGATSGSVELADARKDLKYSCSIAASAMSNSMDMEMSVIPIDKSSASCSIISSSQEQDTNVTEDCPPPPPPPPPPPLPLPLPLSLSSNSLSDFLVNANIYESTLVLNPTPTSPVPTYPINGPATAASSGPIVSPSLESMGISDEMMDLQSYAHHLQPQHPMKSDVQECDDSSENQGTSSSTLQNFLRRKHTLLQKQIKEQQEELKRVSEQLMMVKVVGGNSSSNSSQGSPSGSTTTLSNSMNTSNHHQHPLSSSSSSSNFLASMMNSIPGRLTSQPVDNVDLSNTRDVYTDLPSESVLQDKYLIEGHFISPYSNEYSSIK
ncbi:uncharacterized protein LOC141854873 [Brevipalpus obovatus]|uniref:uncharacterized protein LOC141854873 n=1 Tax=Brevipalpus obovatus TaxID=246614 RepID=UPI003D9F218A